MFGQSQNEQMHQKEYVFKDLYINDPVFLSIFKCKLKYLLLFINIKSIHTQIIKVHKCISVVLTSIS